MRSSTLASEFRGSRYSFAAVFAAVAVMLAGGVFLVICLPLSWLYSLFVSDRRFGSRHGGVTQLRETGFIAENVKRTRAGREQGPS